jgi:mannose/fructose/N-acetylgalactosamine-specific phosphotransferase system component IIB
MSVLLARIDDRYIHGQVVVGCCNSLPTRRLILCDDAVAADPFQSRLYAASVPETIEVEILPVAETAERITDLADEERAHTIVVTGGCCEMLALCELSPQIEEVCLGGLHHRRDTREVWPGFFLDEEDVRCLRALLDRKIRVVVQSVPGARSEDAATALRAESPSS